MKFHSISLKNFGVFLNEKIDFAHRKNSPKVVTFVIGQNGSGKTTLANAMRWCLFGETSFSDRNSIVAIDVLKQVAIGDDVAVEVSLSLEHQGILYTFTRRNKFVRTEDNLDGRAVCREKSSSLYFISSSTTQDGRHETIEQDSTSVDKPVDAIIDKICPKKLRSFIFFNGERIGELARSFEQGATSDNSKNAASDTIKEAVRTLLGLDSFRNGAMHLNGSVSQGTQVVTRLLELEIARLSHPSLKDNAAKMTNLENEIDKIKDKICKLEETKERHKQTCEKCKKEIQTNEEAYKLYQEREKLVDEINAAEKSQNDIYGRMLDRFSDVVRDIAAKNPAMRALENVRGVAPTTEALPFLRAETIDALLKRGKCICGHEIKPGSAEEQALKKLRETLPPHSLSNSLSDFIKAIRGRFSSISLDDAPSEFVNYFIKSQDFERSSDAKKTQIENIDRQLDGEGNFGERIATAQSLLHEMEVEIRKIDDAIAVENYKIKEMRDEIDTLKRELINDEKNKGQKAFFARCIEYAEAVSKRLSDYYTVNEEKVIDRLDKKVKETFALLGLRNEIPSIGRDYVFRCTEQDGLPTRLSESLSFIAALSTITSIIQLGKELVKEDNALSTTVIDSVPLVMDAPLSTFDTTRIKAFGDKMPAIVDQLIVFTKDTEGKIVKPFMADRIGVEYTIVSDSTTRSHFERVEA